DLREVFRSGIFHALFPFDMSLRRYLRNVGAGDCALARPGAVLSHLEVGGPTEAFDFTEIADRAGAAFGKRVYLVVHLLILNIAAAPDTGRPKVARSPAVRPAACDCLFRFEPPPA